MTPEERIGLEKQYDQFAALGWPAASLLAFRRAHGLPIEEAPAPVVRVAPAPQLSPRRRSRRSPKTGQATTTATSPARVGDRFDLQD